MTLRTRLAVGSVCLVAVALVALGALLIRQVQDATGDRAAAEVITVRDALERTAVLQVKRVRSGRRPIPYPAAQRAAVESPTGVAAVLTLDGQQVPLPVGSAVPEGLALPGDLAAWVGAEPQEVASADGPRWVGVYEIDGGAQLLVVVDGRFGDQLVDQIRTTALVGGLALVVALGSVSWWSVWRAFRPLERLAAVADDIEQGDWSRRAQGERGSTEVTRVANAVNRMLDTLGGAIRARDRQRLRAEQFSADVTHELRTPVTSILGYSQLGASGVSWSEERHREMWAAVQREAGRMRVLVDQLVTLDQLESDPPQTPFEPIDLAALCSAAAADSMVMSPDHAVTVAVADGLSAAVDPTAITQILANLLSNVRTHTPLGTSACVTVRRSGDGLEIVVADDGPGVPDGERDRILERLGRASGTTAPGSGLGLSIVRSLARRHGGDVVVDQGPGLSVRVTVAEAGFDG